MDRSNISIAANQISADLHLTSVQTGLLFSAFGWTYVAFQIPGGILADRFGPRLLYTLSLILWSVATLLQGVTRNFVSLFGLRLATGAFEAPAYPINNRIVTSWFPDDERAFAIAVYTSGQYIGLAFLTPVLVGLQYYAGWKGLFIITGLVGVIWGGAWYFLYRDPLKHKKVNEAELKYIEKGGGVVTANTEKTKRKKARYDWNNLKQVFSYRKLWGIYIGQFALTSTLWFFLTWFPTYLVKYRHLDFLKSGFLASLPFLSAFAGILLSGCLSDHLLKIGKPAGFARKIPVVSGLLLSASIIGANYTDNTGLIVFFLSLAFFGNGFASITWVFVSTLAPKNLIGITGGVFNFIGNLSSIVIPVVIGYLSKDGDFAPALVFIGLLGLAGAFSYIFLVGKVEKVVV